jgi:hypothetical protein
LGVFVRIARSALLLAGIGLLVGATPIVEASSTGVTGFSGDPSTGGLYCDQCHSGGVVPVVTISGPTAVGTGTTNTYTLTIAGGQAIAGGLDISASGGSLSVNAGEFNMQLLGGEITHSAPRPAQGFPRRVVWSFDWTAPAAPGTSTIYGAGNSTNDGNGSNGDAAAITMLQVSVTGAAGTPGETSEPGILPPLLVTGYNNLTGEISISYESSCETDQNNIYYGNLADVSLWNWTDQVCDIGVGGAGAFTPAGDSIFFVVVGNKSGKEGSYGQSSAGMERSTTLANVCGETQDLSGTCMP